MLNGAVATDAMNRNALAAALVAGLVLLAGCSSGLTGSQDEPATEESALDGQTTAETIEGETGTVNMYISDEQNAIGDFEHLNVTITKVGMKPAGDDGGDDAEESDDGTETVADDDTDGDGTNEDANTTASGETATETPDAEEGTDEEDDATSSEEGNAEFDEEDDAESDAEDDAESDEEDDAESDEGDGEWVEYEVDNRTVDLTELKGKNATKLSSLEVPNGTYEKVFVYVSDVNGTLKDGSDQRVKLPSGKLQLNSEFTVGDGEEVDFVFDITAVKAGNSGKYILKPVISESGTDVEIEDVDEREDEREDNDDEGEDGEDRSTALNASFDGDVVAGENVTVRVTQDGEAVEGATVFVDGERAGMTDAAGNYVIDVSDDAEELEVTVRHADAEAELEVDLEGESGSEDTDTEVSDTDESGADQQDDGTADGPQQRLTVG